MEPGTAGGDEQVAMLMAEHGALRHADVETIHRYLGRAAPAPADPVPARPAPPARGEPSGA